jgi:hypothetical protein
MSNPGDNGKDPESIPLEEGSMESIDEHCKNFTTSFWTQLKVIFSIFLFAKKKLSKK